MDMAASTAVDTQLLQFAEEWLRLDKNPVSRAEIQRLVSAGDNEALKRCFLPKLSFGTAGLRARMGPGFSQLNEVTIIRASQGLALHLQCLGHVPKQVVIGYDARHNSSLFARLTASIFLYYGFKVLHFGKSVHTPLVPFSVCHFSCAAGVMITASHNPAQDNGYKVYSANGHQIVSPEDQEIAAQIDDIKDLSICETSLFDNAQSIKQSKDVENISYIETDYIERIVAAILGDPQNTLTALQSVPSFVYTPLHGVGLAPMQLLLAHSGLLEKMVPVSKQKLPDPDFPTLQFPNPEEKGALDLAKEQGDISGFSLIIANDPDADRLAVAEKINGKWRQYTGNEVGILLAAFMLENASRQGKQLATFNSTVSTRMLEVMAAKESFFYEETLTGFKWMGSKAFDLKQKGDDRTIYAFEEALGYMFGDVCYDKDGISAAFAILVAASSWEHQENLTLWAKLQQLYSRYGHFAESNTYVRSTSPDATGEMFRRIRALGDPFPQEVHQRPVILWRDLTIGFDSTTETNIPSLPVDSTSQMISCALQGGVRFTIRASGTEPKIKVYVEGTAPTSAEAKNLADETCELILHNWLNVEKKVLISSP